MGRVRRGDLATMAPANPRRSTCGGIVWRVSCLGDRCTDSRACGRIGWTSAGASAGHRRAWGGGGQDTNKATKDFSMDILLQQIINGLVLGSMYALIALGYTMVYGIIQL